MWLAKLTKFSIKGKEEFFGHLAGGCVKCVACLEGGSELVECRVTLKTPNEGQDYRARIGRTRLSCPLNLDG